MAMFSAAAAVLIFIFLYLLWQNLFGLPYSPTEVSSSLSSSLVEDTPAAEPFSSYLRTTSALRNSSNTTADESAQTTASSNKYKKLRLVLHVGPLKTGTTSLQADLTQFAFQNFLERDNWHYACQSHTDSTTGEIIGADLSYIKVQNNDVGNFLQRFKTEMNRLKEYKKNIVLSQEGYSVDFGSHPELYGKLNDMLEDDFDITIVSGYRPYFDWIISMWNQVNKMNYHIYTDPGTWPWENQHTGNLDSIQSMFPTLYGWVSKSEWFTDSIVDHASAASLPVHILDLQDQETSSLTTKFICDVLLAKTTCQESKRRDQDDFMARTVANKGRTNPIFYDAVSLYAASKGLVDTQKWNRTDVQHAIMSHMEEDLHSMASENWPRTCPDDSTLTDLLEKSIQLDTQLFSIENADQRSLRDERLRASFQKSVDSHKFCHVDLDAILEDIEWQQYLKRFA